MSNRKKRKKETKKKKQQQQQEQEQEQEQHKQDRYTDEFEPFHPELTIDSYHKQFLMLVILHRIHRD